MTRKNRACLLCSEFMGDTAIDIKQHFQNKHPTIYYTLFDQLLTAALKSLTIQDSS